MGRGGIPDRWLDYQPVGKRISGTNLVAFKVPLRMTLCRPHLPEDEWFTPAMLLEQLPNLKTVIDLTNTHRYYNCDEEFGTKGIDHIKILVEGKGSIPPNWQIQRFFDAMDAHTAKYPDSTDALVGVHCTHGLNRTGYFICRYMVDRLKMEPDDAIERFNQARGHNIERKPLLESIRAKNLISLPSSSQPPPHTLIDRYYSPLDDAGYHERPSNSRYNRQTDRREYHPNKYRNYGGRGRGRNDRKKSDTDTNWRLRDNDKTQEGDTSKHFRKNREQNR